MNDGLRIMTIIHDENFYIFRKESYDCFISFTKKSKISTEQTMVSEIQITSHSFRFWPKIFQEIHINNFTQLVIFSQKKSFQ